MQNGINLVVPTIVTSSDANSTNFCVPQCLINDDKSQANLDNFMKMSELVRNPFETFKHFKELRSFSLDDNLKYVDEMDAIDGIHFNEYIPSSCPDITECLRESNQILISQFSNATNSSRNLRLSKSNSRANTPSFLGANSLMPGGSRSQSRISLMRTPNGSTMGLSDTNSIQNISSLHLESSSNVLNKQATDGVLKIDSLSRCGYRIKCKNWLQNVM